MRKQRWFYFFQMSKSTGNFLTLTQAVDKFSADGKYVLTCLCYFSDAKMMRTHVLLSEVQGVYWSIALQ